VIAAVEAGETKKDATLPSTLTPTLPASMI